MLCDALMQKGRRVYGAKEGAGCIPVSEQLIKPEALTTNVKLGLNVSAFNFLVARHEKKT